MIERFKIGTPNTVFPPRTEPPERWRAHQHHWLHSEGASQPCMSEWLNGRWHSAGEEAGIMPEEMHQRGWAWYAPAIPPERPAEGSSYVVLD